jgi:hypothetical protein
MKEDAAKFIGHVGYICSCQSGGLIRMATGLSAPALKGGCASVDRVVCPLSTIRQKRAKIPIAARA